MSRCHQAKTVKKRGVLGVKTPPSKQNVNNCHVEFNRRLHGSIHSKQHTFDSIFRFHLTEIGRHFQPSGSPDTFPGL